jgi:hypothetical protein
MATVALDPGLLAYVPSLSKAEVLQRVELLVTWSKIRATRASVNVCLPPFVREYLERNALIPSYEPAKRLLELTGLRNVYSPEDLIRPVYDLLENAFPTSILLCCRRTPQRVRFKSRTTLAR